MSIGVEGAIGLDALGDFAISRAFRVVTPADPNRSSASCKIWGAHLAKGEGRAALIAGLVPGKFNRAYLCSSCVERIEAAHRRFGATTPVP